MVDRLLLDLAAACEEVARGITSGVNAVLGIKVFGWGRKWASFNWM
jgi:hypothetical protein